MLTWHYITRAAYDAALETDKSDDKLFFLSDTKEIYRGTQLFTEAVSLYTVEPTTKAVGRLYVDSTTLEGKIWNGTSWSTVIQPVQAAVVTGDTTKPVSSKAVEDYVATELNKLGTSSSLVSDVAYTSATNTITVTMADSSTDAIPLTNVAADLSYDKATGSLKVVNASGTAIGTGINLDLERFVSSASYDSVTKTITLSFNDSSDPLEINVSDLVDTYTATSSSTVSLTVTGNAFTAEAIVSTAAGNMLTKTDAGLYVAATDISGKVDKVTTATAGDVAVFTADGNLSDSAVKVGGATLAATPNASTLATEAAVNAVKEALTTTINTKMDKVATGHANEIIFADATGNAALSGVTVGGATLAADPLSTVVATEQAVSAYAVAKVNVVAAGSMSTTVAAASDTKVTSEKAVVDALTWKTTV